MTIIRATGTLIDACGRILASPFEALNGERKPFERRFSRRPKTYSILVTENKSVGTPRLTAAGNIVRVFVDNDLQYGYWVPEKAILDSLDPAQAQEYLQGEVAKLEVSRDIAQYLIDIGQTPYTKRKLA